MVEIPFLPRSSMLMPALRVMVGRKMELYASMVEYMDDQIGRVFDYLKEIGEYENTIVIFISDNGAEGNDLRGMVAGRPGTFGFNHAMNNFAENSHNSIGRKGTYTEYGAAWAQVSMTPFRIYKGWLSEGGIRSPLIVSGPGLKATGGVNKDLHYAIGINGTRSGLNPTCIRSFETPSFTLLYFASAYSTPA